MFNNQKFANVLESKQASVKQFKRFALVLICFAIVIGGCKSMNKTQKGVVVGSTGGAVIGGVVGRTMGNTAMGAIIGAAAGGVAGGIIGNKMDKQAEEMAKAMEDAEVIREGEGIVIRFKEQVLFAYDRSDLNEGARASLVKLKDILLKYPETDITIIGHTDSKGSDDYNQTLSERRAGNVKTYTTQIGINSSRLTAIGKGESDPIASNETEESSALNRRVEFVITANSKMIADAKTESTK
jgi:outer membrane protein OmpA-like peptidoglycan-associated protein